MRAREWMAIAVLALTGCGTGDDGSQQTAATDSAAPAAQPVVSDSMTVEGFQAPESVLYDDVGDVYLVANINGNPFDHDDNGFISRVLPDGTVQTLKWIDGSTDAVVLNAPKGMAVKGDTLFVADIDTVRAFDRNSGQPLGARGVPGAAFLNDLSVGADGVLYVTDSGFKKDFSSSGSDAVYAFDGPKPRSVAKGNAVLHGPNGVVATPEGLVIAPNGARTILRIPAGGGAPTTLATLPAGQMDGVVRLADGSLFVSSWEMKGVYHVTPQGEVHTVLENIESPADIGYDTKRGRLLVPDLNHGRLEIRKR